MATCKMCKRMPVSSVLRSYSYIPCELHHSHKAWSIDLATLRVWEAPAKVMHISKGGWYGKTKA